MLTREQGYRHPDGQLERGASGGNVSTTENSTFSSTMVTVVPASRKALRGTRSLSVCCIS